MEKSDDEDHADDNVDIALELFAASPEFHVDGQIHQPTVKRETTTTDADAAASLSDDDFDENEYKAIVYLFMPGGMDSYNLIIPHSQCTGGDGHDLQAQYQVSDQGATKMVFI